jgi:hypothetical protein
MDKTLGNSDVNGARKNVKDIVVFGNGDLFRLICKASSEKEGWMKSTKAMDVGSGVVVQVTTQQRAPDGSYGVAEALTYCPDCQVTEGEDGNLFIEQKDYFANVPTRTETNPIENITLYKNMKEKSPISLTFYRDYNTTEGLFKDKAGTIPVTKDGDVVKLIMDQSGNGNHWISNGLVYRHDGIRGFLETDPDSDSKKRY